MRRRRQWYPWINCWHKSLPFRFSLTIARWGTQLQGSKAFRVSVGRQFHVWHVPRPATLAVFAELTPPVGPTIRTIFDAARKGSLTQMPRKPNLTVMPQWVSHRAISARSSVKVANTRTGFSSRSGGTATNISLAPISIRRRSPAAPDGPLGTTLFARC
jgi:hypothetical protein